MTYPHFPPRFLFCVTSQFLCRDHGFFSRIISCSTTGLSYEDISNMKHVDGLNANDIGEIQFRGWYVQGRRSKPDGEAKRLP
jgi:hypothetical protein